MDKKLIVHKTAEYVKKKLEGESTGHDWWHAHRVWRMAIKIAKQERTIDKTVVELAALLHDIADWKFYGGDDSVGPKVARKWLRKLGVDKQTIFHVCKIIKEMSFKGAGEKKRIMTKEGMVVQDADRLDALGAIGIARCFATSAKLNREIYNPSLKPKLHKTFEEYKNSKSTAINHFYEKILLIKDRLNTTAAKKIAQRRHTFMKYFLSQFYKEWEGEQ